MVAGAEDGSGGGGSWGIALGAGLAVGLAGLGCGIGQGLTAGNTTAGIARNPGAAGAMFVNFIRQGKPGLIVECGGGGPLPDRQIDNDLWY